MQTTFNFISSNNTSFQDSYDNCDILSYSCIVCFVVFSYIQDILSYSGIIDVSYIMLQACCIFVVSPFSLCTKFVDSKFTPLLLPSFILLHLFLLHLFFSFFSYSSFTSFSSSSYSLTDSNTFASVSLISSSSLSPPPSPLLLPLFPRPLSPPPFLTFLLQIHQLPDSLFFEVKNCKRLTRLSFLEHKKILGVIFKCVCF